MLFLGEVGLLATPDPDIPQWAAAETPIILTHDVTTISVHAYKRVDQRLDMPGVIEVHERAPLSWAIEDLQFLAAAGCMADFRDRVEFLPYPRPRSA